jgi:hypothetical protein
MRMRSGGCARGFAAPTIAEVTCEDISVHHTQRIVNTSVGQLPDAGGARPRDGQVYDADVGERKLHNLHAPRESR